MFVRTLRCFYPNRVIMNELNITTRYMSSTGITDYKSFNVTTPKPHVYHVEINRPEKLNAINTLMWKEFSTCFRHLNETPDCRAIVISGAGRVFTAGIDLESLANLSTQAAEFDDMARKAKFLRKMIKSCQDSFDAVENCSVPVISAVHAGCIGAGVDLISATDIRCCTKDAYFQVKEVAIGLAADVGTLQRFPKILGSASLVNELCLTARKMHSDEALSSGLVSKVFDDKDSLMKGALEMAEHIASLSPVAVQGTKRALLYARDHTVQESLDQIADWNQIMLQSEDLLNAIMAAMSKEKPEFKNL